MTTNRATLVVYRSGGILRSQRWRWRLVHANGNILAVSSEGYANRAECVKYGHAVTSGAYDVEYLA